jgi:MazG family protein
MAQTGEKFERAVAIMARLRAPGGCPWDREQSFDTIKPYTIEETYEVIEAIDERNFAELAEELGDLLLQILFYAQMAAEQNLFTIEDVIERLADKLVRRHPHVFGDVEAKTSSDVLRNWEALKAREREKDAGKKEQNKSALAGASPAHPALLEAYKLSSLAANAGFDWPEISGIFGKLDEEVAELQHDLKSFPAPGPRPHGRSVAGSGANRPPEELRARLEGEVGDLLFTVVNLARYLSLDPESALKRTNRKFRRRFEFLEQQLRSRSLRPEDVSLQEMESLWQQSKQQERSSK